MLPDDPLAGAGSDSAVNDSVGEGASTSDSSQYGDATTDAGTDGSGIDASSAAVGGDTTTHHFAVVVGKQSAAIVIDGAIRAAVRLTSQDRLSLEVRSGGVTLADLHHGAAPPDSGC